MSSKEDIAVGEILLLTGKTGSGKTVACASLTTDQRVICLPTRASIIATATFISKLRQDITVAAIFFRASAEVVEDDNDADPQTAGQSGAILFTNGTLSTISREQARECSVVYVTPYQIVHQRFHEDAVYIVDEVHAGSLDRLKAVASLALSGKKLVLASATPPSWLREKLFGRPIVRIELPAPGIKVKVGVGFSRYIATGIHLVLHGRLKEIVSSVANDDSSFALHGVMEGDALQRMLLDISRESEVRVVTVHATVGVAESSITLGDVKRITLKKSALNRRCHEPGCGKSESKPICLSEMLQLLGRGARMGARVCEAVIEDHVPRFEGWHTSWEDCSLPALGDEILMLRRAGFSDYLTEFGKPCRANSSEDRARWGLVTLLEAARPIRAYMEACYGALTKFVESDFDTWRQSLPDHESDELRSGGDLGHYSKEGAAVQRLAGHSAFSPEAIPLTYHAALGLLIQLGPGCVDGAFGASSSSRTDTKIYRRLLHGALPTLPCPEEVPAMTIVVGNRTETLKAPHLSAATVAQIEAIRIGRRPGVINTVGTPMGGPANGPALNASTSLVEGIVSAFYPGLAGVTAGDDLTCEFSEGAYVFRELLRAWTGMLSNPSKTRPTTSGKWTAAPFVEKYAVQLGDGSGVRWMEPSDHIGVARSIVSALNEGGLGEQFADQVSPVIEKLAGISSDEMLAAVRSRTAPAALKADGLALNRAVDETEDVVLRLPAIVTTRFIDGSLLGRRGMVSAPWMRQLITDNSKAALAGRSSIRPTCKSAAKRCARGERPVVCEDLHVHANGKIVCDLSTKDRPPDHSVAIRRVVLDDEPDLRDRLLSLSEGEALRLDPDILDSLVLDLEGLVDRDRAGFLEHEIEETAEVNC